MIPDNLIASGLAIALAIVGFVGIFIDRFQPRKEFRNE